MSTKKLSNVTLKIVDMLKIYKYVGVWVDYFPVFAVDRRTPVENIEYLVNRYRVEDREYLLDGTDICEEL